METETKKMTYREAYDKITKAYLNNELDPYNCTACFVGNLLGNSDWADHCNSGKLYSTVEEDQIAHGSQYSYKDIASIERNFLTTINNLTIKSRLIDGCESYIRKIHPNYENALYEAIVSTLELLKTIHESKGEIVDKPILKKRELVII